MLVCRVGIYRVVFEIDSIRNSIVEVKSLEVFLTGSELSYRPLPRSAYEDMTIQIDGEPRKFPLIGTEGIMSVEISVKRDEISKHLLHFSFTPRRSELSFNASYTFDSTPVLYVKEDQRWLGNEHQDELLMERRVEREFMELPLAKQRKFIEKHYRRLHED